jgi:heme exporter protein A
MGPEPPLLAVTGVGCIRGGKRLFSNRSFEGHPTDLIELRGANGSGKSSMLRLLAGLDQPAEGTINIYNGHSYIGHLDAIKPVFTVFENLSYWAELMGQANIDHALDSFSLRKLRNDPASILSQGQKRRLTLSRLALTKRAVWLLDEPTVGLDATSLAQLQNLITTHRNSGGVVVVATHTDLGLPVTLTETLGEAT